jgi:uncharacterized membrane protein
VDWLSPIRDVFGFIIPFLEHLPVVRALLGFIIVFFLPGFVWTLIFFRQTGVLERIVLSFGLSIAVVTLSILFANLVFGMRITGFNSVLVIMVVTILPVAIYYLNRLVRKKKKKAAG